MIKLTRITQNDPVKRLRAQINGAMDAIEGSQPMVGLGVDVEADYWGDGDNDSGFRHLAHNAIGTIRGTLLLHCLPDSTAAVITGVDGIVWDSARPTPDAGITKLHYRWVTLSIHKVSLPGKPITTFKTLAEYGLTKQNDKLEPEIEHITREPVYPLGYKFLYQSYDNSGANMSAVYLSGTRDKCMIILSTGPHGDRE